MPVRIDQGARPLCREDNGWGPFLFGEVATQAMARKNSEFESVQLSSYNYAHMMVLHDLDRRPEAAVGTLKFLAQHHVTGVRRVQRRERKHDHFPEQERERPSSPGARAFRYFFREVGKIKQACSAFWPQNLGTVSMFPLSTRIPPHFVCLAGLAVKDLRSTIPGRDRAPSDFAATIIWQD